MIGPIGILAIAPQAMIVGCHPLSPTKEKQGGPVVDGTTTNVLPHVGGYVGQNNRITETRIYISKAHINIQEWSLNI